VESPQIVDQATLHKAVSYDPDTGEFSCLAPTGPRSVVGERIDALDDKGYRRVRLFGKKFFAHRLAWLYVTGNWPVDQIDHINLDKGDNRFSNLREANAYQNGYNSSAKNAQGLPKGVVPLPNGKFYAHCRHEGKDHYLGTHDSVPAAKQARDSFAREFHGDFFRE
jgi:hypothetical protein